MICTRRALSSAILHRRSAQDSSTFGGKSHGTHLDRGWRNPSYPAPGISQLLRFATAPVFCSVVNPPQQEWHPPALQRRLRAHAKAQTGASERRQLLRSLPTKGRSAYEGAQCRTFDGPIRCSYVPGTRFITLSGWTSRRDVALPERCIDASARHVAARYRQRC